MEEKIEKKTLVVDDEREVALGICFGCGIGIFVGAIFSNVMLGLSGGGVLGIITAVAVKYIKNARKHIS